MLVLGIALFRDEPVHEVARRLNICARGLASDQLLTPSLQQLRRAFTRMGWITDETETATQAIEDEGLALGDQDTPDSDRETVFELEWQLRDFIPPEFTRQTPNNQQKTVA